MVSRPSNCHVVTLGTLWNMQDTVHIGHNEKPGTTFSMTLWLGVYVIIIISSNDTTDTTNTTRRLPRCVSSQCQNNEINQAGKCEKRNIFISVIHRTWVIPRHVHLYIFTQSHSPTKDACNLHKSICILHMHMGVTQPACMLRHAPGGPHYKTRACCQCQPHAMLTMTTTTTTARRNTTTFNFCLSCQFSTVTQIHKTQCDHFPGM